MTNRNENGFGFAHYAKSSPSNENQEAVVEADISLDGFRSQLLVALELQRSQDLSPTQETAIDQINDFLRRIDEAKDIQDFLANLTPTAEKIAVPKTDAEKKEIGFHVEKPKPTVEISS